MRKKGIDALKAINEFALGDEPDFRTMTMDEVEAYMEKMGVKSYGVYRRVAAELLRRIKEVDGS